MWDMNPGEAAMMLTLLGILGIVGVAMALVARQVMAHGQHNRKPPGEVPQARIDWNLAMVSTLSHAEDLLDWMEKQGWREQELLVFGNSSFGVRWR